MISKKELQQAQQESADRVQAAYDDYDKKIEKNLKNSTMNFKLRTNNRYEVEALNTLLNDYRSDGKWKVTARHEDTDVVGTAVDRTGWYFITLA